MKYVVCLIILVAATGCSTINKNKVGFQVQTDPVGAVIEKDGLVVCDSTPCRVELECKTRMLTGSKKESGVVLTAVPKSAQSGSLFQVSKYVDACAALDKEQALFFNMKLDTVKPKDRIEITTQ